MFYDLNVQWTPNANDLSRTLAFLAERMTHPAVASDHADASHTVGYNAVALNITLTGKFPTDLTCRIPDPLPFTPPPNLTIYRRCTLQINEPVANSRLNALAANYDILALRPTDEKSFQNACMTLDCDLVSLDLSQRLGFFFKFKTVAEAIKRGVPIEINYAQALLGDAEAKRNLISNCIQLMRATRNRGIVISSECKRALGCRGPWDVVNLAAVWSLPQDRAYEAVSKLARAVLATAKLRRTSYRGVVDIVHAGERPTVEPPAGKKPDEKKIVGKKRKIADVDPVSETPNGEQPISKREQKRRAKAAREQQPKVAT